MSDKYSTILDTAYRLFAQQGFEKTSMSTIAKEVGVTKPAVYYYFSSKEKLIRTLFDYILAEIQFSTFFKQEDYTHENFKKKLIADGLNMINQQNEDPYYEKIMSEYYVLSTREIHYRNGLKQLLDDFHKGFSGLLTMAAQFKLIEDQEIETKAQFLTLIVDGLDKYPESEYNFNPRSVWEFAIKSIF